MMCSMQFTLDKFISHYVTKRSGSLFEKDIIKNKDKLFSAIENKSMLVIGGAGSIGSSFIKACLPYRPKSLLVVDINENSLAELTRDLRSSFTFLPKDYTTYPINFASPVFEKIFKNKKGFDIVANFSAHKHVRSEKDGFSVEALLRNNVLNAKKLLELLKDIPPETFFCVSTDKATDPVNVMGASKKIMEDLIFSYSDYFSVKTARFANVAFSNGSLPASFLSRIEKKQAISAPYDVKRFFVSPQESGEICMLACMLGNNREIYFPKPDKISEMTFSDMARHLLQSLGYTVVECSSEQEAKERALHLFEGSLEYPVYFSKSDTTGEKSYEEFFSNNETIDMQQFDSLGVITNIKRRSLNEIESFILELETYFKKEYVKKSEVVDILKKFLPNFHHKEKNKNLDEKM